MVYIISVLVMSRYVRQMREKGGRKGEREGGRERARAREREHVPNSSRSQRQKAESASTLQLKLSRQEVCFPCLRNAFLRLMTRHKLTGFRILIAAAPAHGHSWQTCLLKSHQRENKGQVSYQVFRGQRLCWSSCCHFRW